MTEKFEADLGYGDGFEPAYRALEEKEWDLRVKMFALDMAVQALPTITSGIESEQFKIETVKRAAAEFERYLRGEPTS
jgi:hypothetical protein